MDPTSTRARRQPLIAVAVLCLLVLVLTLVYASLLEDWGGTRGLIFKIVAIAAAVLGIGALLLVLLDSANEHRRRRA